MAALFLRIVNTAASVLGILGNGLVNIVIIFDKSMHTNTNALIVHQASVDFMASLFILLHEYIPPFNPALPGTLGKFLCTFWNSKYFLLDFSILSTYSLLAVTFERFFAIVYPYRYERFFSGKRSTCLTIACVWLVVLTFRVYVFFQWHVDKTGTCVATANGESLGVVIFLLQYAIPLTLMTYMYARIAFELSRSARQIVPSISETQAHQQQRIRNDQGESLLRARRNIFKALLTVFVTFIICWSLNQFLFFFHNMKWRSLDFTSTVYIISVALISLNVFVNPFIYSFKYKRFQHALRRLFYRATCRPDHAMTTNDPSTGAVTARIQNTETNS